MSLKITGTIERSDMGPGTWALIADGGESYEIYQGAPAALLKSGQKVKVEGQIRDDVMTVAMIGPVLEVKNFKVLDSN